MIKPKSSGYVPVSGGEVYYQTYGHGRPILLIHGGFGMIETFDHMIKQLSEHHTVIGVDLQGHGRTAPFDRPMSHGSLADDVVAVIAHIGYERANLLGYSMGGEVALQVALRYPKVVERLVIVSAPFSWGGWHDTTQAALRTIGASSIEPMRGTPLYDMYVKVADNPEENWPKLHLALGGMAAGSAGYDHGEALKRGLPAPTLLVSGDWDSVMPSHMVEYFSRLVGGLRDAGWDSSVMNQHRLAILPGQTHYSIQSSAALSQAVQEFTTSVPELEREVLRRS
ncbi:alpha/beta fold hydrolase [Devosia sediminis]|uniref:Alpha/beta hydrolase n=1 Tax=Devosia sediminis TaxID=2798801 RepID=A0A934IYW9_9HYPH|nr:alpha/beta hydrolase [Devosia sediminis]MBJ3786982.1 alpha/beta hydrolase [Devosia sediminis]